MKPINLGRKDPTTSGPLATVHPASGGMKREETVNYPSLHIHGEDSALGDIHKLPKQGVMHVAYHIHSHEIRNKTSDPKSVKEHHLEIKFHSIKHVEPTKAKSSEEALNSLAKAVKGQTNPDYDVGEGGPAGTDDLTGNTA